MILLDTWAVHRRHTSSEEKLIRFRDGSRKDGPWETVMASSGAKAVVGVERLITCAPSCQMLVWDNI